MSTTSAGGVLALLEESDDSLQTFALEKLSVIVDEHWSEIADSIELIEELSEDDAFPARELAASVASKCFFHLEEYSDALRLALGAGEHFDVSARTEYVETLIAKCIDEYVSARRAEREDGGGDGDGDGDGDAEMGDEDDAPLDPRMEDIVERMFERCYAHGTFRQALGIALEAQRLDKVEAVILRAPDTLGMIAYCISLARSLIQSRTFRLDVFRVLVKLYKAEDEPDHTRLCECLQILDDPAGVAAVLETLIRGSEVQALTAFQVAFDIVDSDNQSFVTSVGGALPSRAKPEEKAAEKEDGAEAAGSGAAETGETADAKQADAKEEAGAAETKNAEEKPTEDGEGVPEGAPESYWDRLDKLRLILVDGFSVDLILNFLYQQSNTDQLLISNIKTAVENRNSVLHNATVVAHGYMTSGTTVDTFLRENLEWMGKANNWAKFTAVASIGMVHKGHIKESMNLLQPYLPQGGVSASPYSEAGALFALGLIHANKGNSGEDALTYLTNALQNANESAANKEVLQHGACLGIGLTAMATGSPELVERLRDTLYSDDTVAGEAAAMGMGLVLLGHGTTSEQAGDAVHSMLEYAHETNHEKIVRGIALAVSLIMYEREEQADTLIEQLSRDRDPAMRYGACYTIAMAYVGTGNNGAIRRLLHVAVSDVSDDVRRAAVTCLGFVLCRSPEKVPELVGLLAESFNPHVRYGSCLAVGIACAGTGDAAAAALLEKMLEDPVDYVRQGAMISTAMIMMQQAESRPKVKAFREKLSAMVTDKHQSTMSKMGAIIAQGIIDAGGRNVVISLTSRAGFVKMSSVVGLAVWAQYWYWYPLMQFLSLSFTPTMLVGLNKDFMMPKKYTVVCNAKPSAFAYPKKLVPPKKEEKKLTETAVLSITAKAKARHAKKQKEKDGDSGGAAKDDSKMDVDSGASAKEEGDSKAGDKDEKAADAGGEEQEEKEKAAEPEPSSFTLSNPARVTRLQEPLVNFEADARYQPVTRNAKPVGIVILMDRTPDEEEEVEAVDAPPVGAGAEEEADPPEAFEWTPPTGDDSA